MSKKFFSIALSVMTIGAFMGPVAYGQSTDLQAQINELLAKIATLQALLAGQTGGTGATACTFTKDLTLGVTGTDVQCLQQYLNGSGYTVATSGAGSPGNETTYFGSRTQAAVSKWQAANGVTPTAGYFGRISRAKYAAIAGTPGGGVPPGGGVVTPGTGLTVMLASDNPAGKAVPFGANNVEFLKFILSGSGTVDTMTFTRVGAGVTADFQSSGVYLIDETGTRLTTGRTVNSTTHQVTFTGLKLNISGTKTLKLVAAVRTNSSGAGNRDAFELTSASNITGSVTVGGAYPIRGNEFSLTSAGVPGVTISSSTDPTNPKVGEVKARIATVKVENTSSTDDVMLEMIRLRYAGAVSRSNLSNFVVEYAGSQVASGGPISSNDLLTLKFSPTFKLERGQNRIFDVFADIAPGTRSGSAETIIWYIEDTNDVVAVSSQYGYGAIVTNSYGTGSTAGQNMTIDGGQITISFNGPNSSDIPTNGQDVTFLDFTVAAANNVEVKNLRFSFTGTGLTSATNEKISDFKVVDTATGSVIAGPYGSDLSTTTTGIVLNDTWTISAGQSRRLKVTGDVGSASALANDTAYVTLVAFNGTDIKNVDSNTDVATGDIVNNAITGNTMTVKAPDLSISLAGTPSSRTLTQGARNVDMVAFTFRAVADDIQVKTITVSASSTTGAAAAADVTAALGSLQILIDGVQVGTSKSLSGSSQPVTAEFNNLNYKIVKGMTKTILVRALAISNSASSTSYAVRLNNLANDVVAVDSQGNTLTLSGNVNAGTGTVVLTIAAPTLTITRVGAGSTDTDSLQIIGNKTQPLTRLEFRATNGDVTVKKIQFGVSDAATNVTATSLGDDILKVSLKRCSDQSCSSKSSVGLDDLTIDAAGERAGTALAESVSGFFEVLRSGPSYFTLEGAVGNVITGSAEGAESGQDIYASLRLSNFEAVSGNTTLTTYATSTGGTSLGVTGLQKELLRAQPVITVSKSQGILTAGLSEVLRMTVDADGGSVALKGFGINLATTLATFSTAFSASNVNVGLVTDPGTNLVGSVSGATINSGASGDLYIIFTNPQIITQNAPRTFIIKVTPDQVGTSANGAKVVAALDRNESSISNNVTTGAFLGDAAVYNYVNNTKVWVWSDLSDDSTGTENSTQWSNAYMLRPFPTDSYSVTP